MKNYLLIGSLVANVLVVAFWCPLHGLFPCGDGGQAVTAPVTVETIQVVDSTQTQLPEVNPTPKTQTWVNLNLDKVKRLESKNRQLQKQHRADSLALALVTISKQTTDNQNRLLRQFVDGLTKQDSAALVHKAIFEKNTVTKTFRKDSVAEVAITTTTYQNEVDTQTAVFKNLAPLVTNNITSHYKERFQVFAGVAITTLTDKDFNSAKPFGGPALDFKFSSGTTVSTIAQVGPQADLMLTLKATQLLRFPKARAWIERRKILRAIKHQ